MPQPNGVAGIAPDAPAQPTVCDLLVKVEDVDRRIAFYREKLDECNDEKTELLAGVARTIRSEPDRVITHLSSAYLLLGGIVARRPCAYSHDVAAVAAIPEKQEV